jgi:hypothetical protein
MTLHHSIEQERNFLTAYHFQQTDLPGVFARLGTVQYDPLNPVGRNPDKELCDFSPQHVLWLQKAFRSIVIA